ncbi:MAG: DUF4349 domain-containing protein [Nocardioides sp.]|nr:DUF4349 domain-containing protein [Nocardioides sp.]
MLLIALALSACSSGSTAHTDSEVAAGHALQAPSAGSAKAPAGTAARPPVEQASIISTGSVSLRARDVGAADDNVHRIMDQYAAKLSEERTGTGYVRVVMRVPAASFTDAMQDVEKVADLVTSSTTSKDVSTQVVDVDERVASARASLARIRTLLARADKIGDVISIESELAQREADLNSLLGQQAHLADQTALSTITVTITHAPPAKHHPSSHSGFLAGLGGGWHALRAVGTGLATVAGALLPWLPVAVVVGVPVWSGLRRRRAAVAAD